MTNVEDYFFRKRYLPANGQGQMKKIVVYVPFVSLFVLFFVSTLSRYNLKSTDERDLSQERIDAVVRQSLVVE